MGEVEDIIVHKFRGRAFYFHPSLDAPDLIKEIFADNYCVLKENIKFSDGDVILDVGANEGMFSIMMAGLFPQAKVIALEPVPRTFTQLVHNVGLNACENISCFNVGVSKPGDVSATLNVSKDHSGGSTSLCEFNPDHHYKQPISVLPLDEIFRRHEIERCRFLKMDIEGMEYEALYPCTVLPRVDYMGCEIHFNARLDYQARRPDGLRNWLSRQTKLISVEFCNMAE